MKKVTRILFVGTIFIMFFITISYGFGVDELTGNQTALTDTKLKATGDYIVSIITEIGVVTSVIVLAVLGVKYMLGSVEERAEYKKTLMPYVIGSLLLFGASSVAQIIYLVAKDL